MYEFVKVCNGGPSRINGKGTANSKSWLRNQRNFWGPVDRIPMFFKPVDHETSRIVLFLH